MFCKPEDLSNESDVEQKVLMPLLREDSPGGLGYRAEDVWTKKDIRTFKIDKGTAEKLYFPDYVVVLAGLPVLVVEAKTPGANLTEALREARLYAQELNALYPAGLNPCVRIIASDGLRLLTSPVDTSEIDATLELNQLVSTNIEFAKLLELCGRQTLKVHADLAASKSASDEYWRAGNFLGGQSVRNEELGYNTFGSRIALKYRHLFNPSTTEDRKFIAKNAYIPSHRRERYVEPIDEIVRAAVPPSVSDANLIEETEKPKELIQRLKDYKELEHQVLLLVGSVGAGKTTFVDYLNEVALEGSLKEKTNWLHVNLNNAPVDSSTIYQWTLNQIRTEFETQNPELDFEVIDTLLKIYSVEVNKLKKGALALLSPDSEAYNSRLAERILALQSDSLATVKSYTRYLCAEKGRALIIVLDNCDKRKADEQLLMFQLAQWLKTELRCLVFLPLRDVTYDLYRNTPPLDTALKDLVFRIEPPLFSRVLAQRIKLALAQMKRDPTVKILNYRLPSGLVIEYPSSDLGVYLAAITRSLFEHDKLIRRMITGLAGRDVRKAMEIFLEFCSSGHIDEGEFMKIRNTMGGSALPYRTVTRVLLRLNRRFYNGDESYVKNLLQCRPKDAKPNIFTRLAILQWLQTRFSLRGPTAVRGYHRTGDLIRDLVPHGYDAERLHEEVLYLMRAGCIINEHQDSNRLASGDLISLSSSGWVHLDLVGNLDYLAACIEDSWLDDRDRASRVAERIGAHGAHGHYQRATMFANAKEMLEYARSQQKIMFANPESYLKIGKNTIDEVLNEADREYTRAFSVSPEDFEAFAKVHPRGTVLKGRIVSLAAFGAFVELVPGIDGLLHSHQVGRAEAKLGPLRVGDYIDVRVFNIDLYRRRIPLDWHS